MTKKDNTDIEYLVNLEVMTIKQAQVYVEEKTGMRSSMFYDCVRPLLSPKPIAQNFRTNRPAHLVVRKEDVDEEIAKMKLKILHN
ncbi:hypothetical protein [Rhodohalobacter mucosus]|uniref:Uncharacterized protein n=1 Tax=Rhodohalobacter mucosus TaxID=2079485 RepID=A0A316TVB1_9BACT|nr:hypothetical protein [Rhodohalobacter mucosus]PWN06392.1 hypothetical protein DDZ15_09755 [Rhodohalobacter mucosus]